VILLKKKITAWRLKLAKSRFFSIFNLHLRTQEEMDKSLVYSLSSRKIPNRVQFKYLRRFLNPREHLVIKICLLIILVNAVYLGIVFFRKHLEATPLPGGQYIEGVVGYPKNINPLYASSRDIDDDLSRLIYSRLFAYDTFGQLAPDIASSYEISSDGREYIIKIRDDVTWHNGGQLKADDVIFTFNLIKDPAYRSSLAASFSGVDISKVDDYTLKFSLSEPYAPFLELLTFGIMPGNIWNNIDANNASLSELNLKPVGSGPYRFKSLVRNRVGDLKEYRLAVNDNYYGQAPYIKSITFKFYIDYAQAIEALNDGQVDGLSYLPLANRAEVLAKNSFFFYDLVRPQVMAIFFNGDKNKQLADKGIRSALRSALDKDNLVSISSEGIYRRADGPILSFSAAYNPDIMPVQYDPEGAAVALGGKSIALTITVVDYGNNLSVAQAVKDYWEKAGVKVDLKIVSAEQAADLIKSRDFEIILYGQAIGGDPDIYAFWHSSQSGASGLNLAGYRSEAADKLLSEARTSVVLADRIEKYRQFQEILNTDVPAIFLYSPTYTYIHRKSIKGFSGDVLIKPADRFSGIAGWYVRTKKKLAW